MQLVRFSSVVLGGGRWFAEAWIDVHRIVWVRPEYYPEIKDAEAAEHVTEVMLEGYQDRPIVIRAHISDVLAELRGYGVSV